MTTVLVSLPIGLALGIGGSWAMTRLLEWIDRP